MAGQEAMSGLLSIVSASDADFNKLTESINNADGASKQMANTMANNLQGQFTLLKSSAEGFGLALYDKIQQPLTDMVSWAVDGLNQLTKAFNENGVDGLVEAAGNILSEAINEIVNGLPKIVDLAIRVIDSFISGLNKNLDTIVIGAVSVVETLTNGILNMLPQIVQLGLDLIVSLANGIAESLPTLIPTIMDVIMQIVHILTDPANLTNLLNAALTIITELAYGLMDAIPQLVQAVSDIIINIADFLVDPVNLANILKAAVDVVIALAVGLVDAIPVLLKHLPRLWSSIIDNFRNVDWGQLGRNLVDGFKNGISRAWTSLKTWFKNLFGDLIGIAKKILGIASPSKVFKKIGGFTAEGFGAGFEDEFAHVKDDMEDALNFDDASVGINASIRKVGAGAAGGAFGGTSIGNININIDGAKYTDEQSLASAIAVEIQNMTDRRAAVYA